MSANALGALYMVIGSLAYVVNDALMRAATDEGLDIYQAVFFRGVAMAVLFAAAASIRDEQLTRAQLRPAMLVRVATETVATGLFFAGLVHLEFANAQTILLVVPFAVTVVAARFGETVSLRQYLTVLAGFAGVVAVMRPGTGAFSMWSLAILASAASQTVREFATRRIPASTPAVPIGLLTAMSLSVLMGIVSIFTGWGEMTIRGVVFVGLACLCLVVGYVFTIQTVRVGDLSVSAPFRYTTLVGSVIIGLVAFDEVPDALTVIGCAVILGAGLYAIHLERQRPVPAALRA